MTKKSLLSKSVLKTVHIQASSTTYVIISQKTMLRRLLGCLILNYQKTNKKTMIDVAEVMEIFNIKELPPIYKDQLGDRLNSYKMIGVFDKNKHRPLKVYVHFMDFRIKQLKNIVENPVVGQTSNLYIYRLADLAFDENGTIIKDRYPPIL